MSNIWQTLKDFFSTRAGVILAVVLVICVTLVILSAMYFGRSFSELYQLITDLVT